ncbi:MAG TPA: hypothetical protein VK639_21310, partial [Terriglobales bacterium]|nr:hypothetical protein [Terriglobales bacterium]
MPLFPDQSEARLKICLLVRDKPSEQEGYFVLLRHVPFGRVYQGCLVDSANRVLQWLEIGVETTDALHPDFESLRGNLNNSVVDKRWQDETVLLSKLWPEGIIHTGFEKEHPLPTWLDPRPGKIALVHPLGKGRWELCQDDQLLRGAGLPEFHTTIQRYLYLPEAGDEKRFLRVMPDAPRNEFTLEPEKAIDGFDNWVPFNPTGGLLMMTKHFPFALLDYVNLLTERSPAMLASCNSSFKLPSVYAENSEDAHALLAGSASLYWGFGGAKGRLLETFHLKLQLWAELLQLVRAAVEELKQPLLSIEPDSFRIRWGEAGLGLPVLWTAKAALVRASKAFPVSLEGSQLRYYVRLGPSSYSHYFPSGQDQMCEGVGEVLITELNLNDPKNPSIAGTLTTSAGSPPPVSPWDLIWMRPPLRSGCLIHARITDLSDLGKRKIHFRSAARKLAPEVLKELQKASRMVRVPYGIVPLLSTQCDLYAVGVLGVQLLLQNGLSEEDQSLGSFIEKLSELGQEAAFENSKEQTFAQRVCKILTSDADRMSVPWSSRM